MWFPETLSSSRQPHWRKLSGKNEKSLSDRSRTTREGARARRREDMQCSKLDPTPGKIRWVIPVNEPVQKRRPRNLPVRDSILVSVKASTPPIASSFARSRILSLPSMTMATAFASLSDPELFRSQGSCSSKLYAPYGYVSALGEFDRGAGDLEGPASFSDEFEVDVMDEEPESDRR